MEIVGYAPSDDVTIPMETLVWAVTPPCWGKIPFLESGIKNKEKILSSVTATTTSSATRTVRSRNNTIEEKEKRLCIWIDDEIERKMPLNQSTFLIKWQKIGNTEETE
ncbi:hypothetical protein TNCV_3575911 [Trichonephila clavipes]|nr:hypothetical protein TNCV_3575911 [Trichonephila clavipes]